MSRRLILLLLTPALLGLWQSRSYGDALRINHWEQITYYRHTFEAEAAVSGVLRITAVGDYELYLNGTQIATEADWRTTEEIAVDLQEGDNHIGVRVANPGTEAGNGLLLSLQAGSQVARSSFTDDTSLWLWTGEAQEGDGWTTQNVARTWTRVQAGSIDRLQVQGGIFHPDAEVVAGYPLSVNVGSSTDGRIVLADQRGLNIALGLNASEVGVTDGVIGTPVWSIPQGLRALNELVDITLPELTRISRVRVITKPPSGNETYIGNSLLGYSVQISEDKSRWIEMSGINDIQNFVFTEVSFEPVLARFVRVQVTQAEVGRDPARVTEIQIYGVDFVPEGTYISPPLDFGAPDDVKNFGTVQWWANVPPAAQLTLQFSTGDSPDTTAASWSAWSEEFEQSGVLIPSPEPRRYLRYRANLKTDDFEFTPVLDSLEIDYTTGGIAAQDASGSVSPNEAAMGEDVVFRYRANLQLAEGDAVSKVRIRVPSLPTQIQGMSLLGQDIAVVQFPTGRDGIDVGGGRVLHLRPGGSKELDISFEPPLTAADGTDIPLEILLQAALFTDTHEFRAFLFSPGVENPQNFREDVADGASWKVVVTDVLARDLLDVRSVPQIITPNGDGINDFAVIEFTLTKVAKPRRVDVDIFDLSGRRVRRLDTPPLVGGRYVNPLLGAAEAQFIPGFWDGTNEAGELVPPGIYAFTVRVDLDTGDETASGVVYVVY